ncbi:MAG: hypothetical protein IJW54_02200 [Clostridia bacterium]|nr:hypothetical protein [Clostridia bacterium]
MQIPKPTKRTKFEANKGKKRRPGTGSIKKVAINTWQGRYAPTVNGKRIIRHIYANSIEECEQRLAELIAQMKEEYKLV